MRVNGAFRRGSGVRASGRRTWAAHCVRRAYRRRGASVRGAARAVIAFAALGALLAATSTPSAGSAVSADSRDMQSPTYMYVGKKLVGSIVLAGTRFWREEGCGYVGAWANANKNRSRVNIHYVDDTMAGYARIESLGKWLVFTEAGRGTAVRRNANRWDVSWNAGGHGHTQGPEGPAAAAMLIAVC
jgi:hypothetical protein